MKIPDHLLNKIESLAQELLLYNQGVAIFPEPRLVFLCNEGNFLDTFENVKKSSIGRTTVFDAQRNGYKYTVNAGAKAVSAREEEPVHETEEAE